MRMSEEVFRDTVVRPLFFRMGLRDGRDTCGPFEMGKDAIFLSTNPFGTEEIYVVQTKKGRLNLAKIAQLNLIEAITQLKTACQTKVNFIKTREKNCLTKSFCALVAKSMKTREITSAKQF